MAKNKEYYKLNQKTIGIAILVIVIAAILVGVYLKGGFSIQPEETTEEETEEATIPEFELIAIQNEECTECLNVTESIDIIKQAPTLKITSDKVLSFESEEAKKLIKKYSIERLPAFILKGEKVDADLPPFEKVEDALVFKNTPPVYYDLKEERAAGKVNLIIIAKEDCEECFDMSGLSQQLEMIGMVVVDEKTVEYDSKEGKALIEEYEITKIPTMILSEDAILYDQIKAAWDQVGSVEDDGKLVMREVNPPFYDLEAKKVKGIVDITYIVDEDCEECYDPKQFKTYFGQQIGVGFDDEETIDVSSDEGKELIKTYNITLVPTVIFSKDLGEYPAVKQLWSQLGKIVNGKYVFTTVDQLKNIYYKDLATGEIMGEGPEQVEIKVEDKIEIKEDTEAEDDSEEINVPEELVEE